MNFRSLVKRIIPSGLFSKVEPYGHLIEAVLAQIYFGFPARKLKVIGVTGTDGKTSTCSLIKSVLEQADIKVAMMTTISVDYGDGQGEHPNKTRLTTVGAFALVRELRDVKRAGAEWLILETTSHALAQHRVWHVPYTIAVLTNLQHEHLDYHGTFSNYRRAKARLFEQCNRNKRGLRSGVVNSDDPNAQFFIDRIKNSVTYGLKSGNFKAENVQLSASESQFHVSTDGKDYSFSCHLPGSFNVYNSLAAIAVGKLVGIPLETIQAGIAKLSSVEGRMTAVKAGQDFDVIVDYAHTPESFEKILHEVRLINSRGRLIVLFGSAGRRDEAKRALQGEIAGKLSDVVIVTEEDDRDADGHEILEQIATGAIKEGKELNRNLFLIHDRETAIEKAVTIARSGDVVMLLGKGHEKSILSNGPKAAELRHLPQDDTDSERVVSRPYNEVAAATVAIKKVL